MTESPTWIKVNSASAPSAYWDGWATVERREPDGTVLLRTTRTGSDGRSDAQYIVDRLASGLYWASILDGDGNV